MNPQQVFKLIETNPNKPNIEGKRQAINEVIDVLPENHIEWLFKVLKDKYNPPIKEEEEINGGQ